MKGYVIFETTRYFGSYEEVSNYEIVNETVYKDEEQAKEQMLSRIKEIANEYDMLEDEDFLSELESIEENCFEAGCDLFPDFDNYTIKIIEIDNVVDNGCVFVECLNHRDFFKLHIINDSMYKDINTEEFMKKRMFEECNEELRVSGLPQYNSIDDEDFLEDFKDSLINEDNFRLACELGDLYEFYLDVVKLKMA